VIGQIFVSLAIVYFGHIIGKKTEAANIFGIFFCGKVSFTQQEHF
jgi:hypothetical protein